MDPRPFLRTAAAVAAGLAVAVGAVACGGDDDDGGAERAGSQPAAQDERGGKAGGDGAGKGGRKQAERRDGGGAGNGGGGDGAPPVGGGSPDEPVSLVGDKREAGKAADVTAGAYDAIRGMERTGGDELVADGGGGICDLMSEAARKQTVEYARRSSGLKEKWTCPKAIGLLVGRSQRLGTFGRTLKAEVVGVNAEGDRATATIRFGKGPLTSVPLVKEDGEWKLGASPATGGE